MRKALIAMLAALSVGGCFSRPTRTAAPIDPATPRVSVMTYNVNFGMADDPATLAAVANAHADVMFLQETTERGEANLRARLGAAYPHMQFKHWPPR